MVLREGLARAVGKLRHSPYVSQEKLAEVSGLSSSLIGEIERGLANPTADSIERLAKGLGVTPLFLVRVATAEDQEATRLTPLKEPHPSAGYPPRIDQPQTFRYPVVIERAPVGYSAYSPDLPSCAAIGPTRQAVEAAMQKEISDRVARLRPGGRPMPEPSTSIVWIEVPG